MEEFYSLHKRWRSQNFSWQVLNSELFGLIAVAIFAQHIPPGDIIDAGCNVGHVSLPLGQLAEFWGKQIVAVDAQERYKDIVEGSLRSYEIKRLSFIHAAVSDFDGPAHFWTNSQEQQRSQLVGAQDVSNIDPRDIRSVNCLTIDTLCARQKLAPAIIKLDVESNESRAIRGAFHTLSNCHPIVLFEWGQTGTEESEFVFTVFEMLGYTVIDHFGFVFNRELWSEHTKREVSWNRYAYPSQYSHLSDFLRESFHSIHAMYGFHYDL